MEVNDQNLSTLRSILLSTIQSDNNIRREAEAYITSLETQNGFLIVLLHLITILSDSSEDKAIRVAASIFFKNAIKKRWNPTDDEIPAISPSDRSTIKSHLITLMCSTTPDVQRQLSEAVSLISTHESLVACYPTTEYEWTDLLPQLVAKLVIDDLRVTQGVMLTANSIMKRFRNQYKSDQLFDEILVCLKAFSVPLLESYKRNGELIVSLSDKTLENKDQILLVLETQRLMSRIFFSLNWQDIPTEVIDEETIAIWMGEFLKFMNYKNPLLDDSSEDNEPGPVEKLQVAIMETLNLYATKYEEEFSGFLGVFTQCVWKLLVETGPLPKYDLLC
jgi:exportin-2 (importin alpha re-exporter)